MDILNIKDRMEHYNVSGLSLSLIENGQISLEESHGVLEIGTNKHVNNNSIFNACSISKFVTGMLVMRLIDQGILDLDEDVNERLISWKVPKHDLTGRKKVTLRNLLSHQSGIIDPKGSFSELNPNLSVPSMAQLLKGTTPYCNVPIEVKYEPESDFHYSDAGFCIIQQLIEDETGHPFTQVMNEHLFQPLSMKNSTYKMTISDDKSEDISCGHNKIGKVVDGKYPIYPYPAASGLWTNPTDLAILVIELINALKGESKIGLSSRIAKEMIKAKFGREWTGLGVFLDDSGKEMEISSLGWGVGFQCMMVAYPYLGSGVVIMTNTDLGKHQLKGIIGEVFNDYKCKINLI